MEAAAVVQVNDADSWTVAGVVVVGNAGSSGVLRSVPLVQQRVERS